MAYTAEERARIRAEQAAERQRQREQRQTEREQRQMLRAMRRQLAEEKKNTASSKIPAKWYARGSKAIAIGDNSTGERVIIKGGLFYAGCNMNEETMVTSHIKEPSLINPLYEVHYSNESVRMTDKNPVYATLTAEQRGEYIRFLASDRTQATDIGYPFIYLYGLERRLLIDSRRPNEVSDSERMLVSQEVLRLLRCFGPQSRSFALYAASLLLYDGLLASKMSDKEFSATFAGDLTIKRLDWHVLTGAYEYMLLARMAARGMKFPTIDFLNYCRIRPFIGGGASFLGYSERDMFRSPRGKAAWNLMKSRYKNSSLAQAWPSKPIPTKQAVGRRLVPEYLPGSRGIGAAGITDIARKLPDLECFDAPFKHVADMGTTAMIEVGEYQSMLEGKGLGAIGNVHLDVIGTVTPPRMLARDLKGKKAFSLVSHETLAKELEQQFGIKAATTQNGCLNVQTQSGYQILAASLGWQLVLPESLPKEIGKFVRVGIGDDVLAFKRGGQYDVHNGIQFIGSLTSSRDVSIGIHVGEGGQIDGDWLSPIRASVLFAWFVREFSDRIPLSEFGKYLGIFRPPIKKKRSNRQIVMFYCLVNAFLRYPLSQAAPRECMRLADFQIVKQAVFTWCYDHYGLMLPHEVMSMLEKLYARAQVDKSMILYDYHAFTAGGASPSAGTGMSAFSIDDERLRDIIEDTSGVHSILNGAMDIDDEEEDNLDLSEERDVDIMPDDMPADEDETSSGETGAIDLPAVAREYIRSVYADAESDEMPTKDLQVALMEQFALQTTAAAMGLISDVNALSESETGEPLIEVDGPDAYLNE